MVLVAALGPRLAIIFKGSLQYGQARDGGVGHWLYNLFSGDKLKKAFRIALDWGTK